MPKDLRPPLPNVGSWGTRFGEPGRATRSGQPGLRQSRFNKFFPTGAEWIQCPQGLLRRARKARTMPELTRISISLETALLEAFDRHLSVKGYATRSEALRDLIRERLIREETEAAE